MDTRGGIGGSRRRWPRDADARRGRRALFDPHGSRRHRTSVRAAARSVLPARMSLDERAARGVEGRGLVPAERPRAPGPRCSPRIPPRRRSAFGGPGGRRSRGRARAPRRAHRSTSTSCAAWGVEPGELNHYFYQPRGLVLALASSRRPLTSACTMAGAALAAGDPVVLKPGSRARDSSALLARLLVLAGFPAAAVGFLPVIGAELGDDLVSDGEVDLIAFTGSRPVALRVAEIAGRRRLGRPRQARHRRLRPGDSEACRCALPGPVPGAPGGYGEHASARLRPFR